jgi:hypothetical protein
VAVAFRAYTAASDTGGLKMAKIINISAMTVLITALSVLVVFQWLPALLFLPVGAAVFLLDNDELSANSRTGANTWPK